MCGIAGYKTTNASGYKLKVATAILATHMEARGGHSWGYMTGTATQHGLGSIDLGLRIPAKMPLSFALHTRYATTGERTLANCHPFTADGTAGLVVGVHNGIISNHAALNHRYSRACAVDSQHIFMHIANGMPLDDLEGYGAIVYTLNDEWHIGRFNGGEMRVAMTDGGIVYASTKDAVMQSCSYADLTILKWIKVADNTVYKLTALGLTKAYRVKARETYMRWDDAITGTSHSHLDDEWNDYGSPVPSGECDWCRCNALYLYEYDGQLVCAECYSAETEQLPLGYVDDLERRAYSYAANRVMAQGAL